MLQSNTWKVQVPISMALLMVPRDLVVPIPNRTCIVSVRSTIIFPKVFEYAWYCSRSDSDLPTAPVSIRILKEKSELNLDCEMVKELMSISSFLHFQLEHAE